MVKDFLNFYCTSASVGLSVLSEFILFISNKKEILRLSLTYDDFMLLQNLCDNHNLKLKYTSFKAVDYGGGWASLVKNNGQTIDKNSDTVVVVIGNTADKLSQYIDAEAKFDYIKAGELLGYPQCCIKSYLDIEILKHNWYQYYLRDGKMKYPHWANRINTIFGGGSFVGEMFPCSLNCKKAIDIGKNAANTMHSFGLIKLAEVIKSHCLSPIYLDEFNSISKIVTQKKIEFY